MKVKRFVADDMRNALRQVREELGADAVILSNRKINGRVEILAVRDYDEQLINQALERSTEVHEPMSAAEYFEARAAERSRQEEEALQASPPDEAESARVHRQEIPTSPAAEDESTYRNVRHQASGLLKTPQPDPGIVEMRDELKYLRAMIESQSTLGEWNRQAQQHPLRISLYKKLSEMGLSQDVCKYLAKGLEDTADIDEALQKALKQLVHQLPTADDDILSAGGVYAMVGPTGVGKTTTIAKLAARFAMRHGQRHVALISTDNYRIGAHEQLMTYGRLLSVPVHTANNGQELQLLLNKLYDKKLILIDTAGMSQRDLRLSEQFTSMMQHASLIRTYLVLSANAQLSNLNEVIDKFRKVNLTGCILTKLDEAVSLGNLLSALLRHNLPAAYVSYGQRVPEDLQPARARELVRDMLERASQHRERLSDEFLAVAFNENVSHANFNRD